MKLATCIAPVLTVCLATASTADELPDSEGVYRLPYADGVVVKVFDDFRTHRPKAALDLFAVGGGCAMLSHLHFEVAAPRTYSAAACK
jgi:hypothetical protein